MSPKPFFDSVKAVGRYYYCNRYDVYDQYVHFDLNVIYDVKSGLLVVTIDRIEFTERGTYRVFRVLNEERIQFNEPQIAVESMCLKVKPQMLYYGGIEIG